MIIRSANLLDTSALILMIMKMHTESKVDIPPLNVSKVSDAVTNAIKNGLVYVALEEENLIGSIGGIVSTDWFSEEKILGDLWFYVDDKHRSSNTAVRLIKQFISAGKKAKIKIRLGHIYFGDIKRKYDFYNRLGFNLIGQIYSE